MEKPIEEIRAVIAWMENQMYDERTEWTYGNEHDRMHDAYALLIYILPDD